MRTIPLTRGLFTIVDEADYPLLSQYSWYADPAGKTGQFYAKRAYRRDGRLYTMRMHVQLLGAASRCVVDHINGNRLDNRRSNLRLASFAINAANSKFRKNNTTGYRGVVWHPGSGKWRARISIGGKLVQIGMFHTPQEASLAFEARHREVHGGLEVCYR